MTTERLPKFVKDARVTLCNLSQTAGALSGVADGALEPTLSEYAAAQGLTLQVEFPQARVSNVVWGRTPLFSRPSAGAETVSEVGFSEPVNVYDAQGGFVRVAAQRDGYLGWVPAAALGVLPEGAHRLTALRSHVYARPEVEASRLLDLAYGAPLCVLDEADGWSRVALAEGDGYVHTLQLEPRAPLQRPDPEAIVRFALRFLETPYVWGGVSAWGLDCSGLVQSVYRAFDISLPRDADQQAECGQEILPDEVRAADLLFFPGHVAIALDKDRFVHANVQHMAVSVDSFTADAYGRKLRELLTQAVRVV